MTVLGFVQTNVTIIESDGVVQLTVPITVPSQTPTFSLLVHTLDGTATGLLWCLFDYVPTITHYFISYYVLMLIPTYVYTHTYTHTFYTSVAPGDYGALTEYHLGPFNNNVHQLSFNVSIINDNTPEDAEVFNASLTIDSTDQARLGNPVRVSPNEATVTIQDNHGKKHF